MNVVVWWIFQLFDLGFVNIRLLWRIFNRVFSNRRFQQEDEYIFQLQGLAFYSASISIVEVYISLLNDGYKHNRYYLHYSDNKHHRLV